MEDGGDEVPYWKDYKVIEPAASLRFGSSLA